MNSPESCQQKFYYLHKCISNATIQRELLVVIRNLRDCRFEKTRFHKKKRLQGNEGKYNIHDDIRAGTLSFGVDEPVIELN